MLFICRFFIFGVIGLLLGVCRINISSIEWWVWMFFFILSMEAHDYSIRKGL